ncbi:phage tail protein [Desulfonatronovibrio hydrogenovorans]|uniref:phage tail protein n=1 Tax=Desulfonatronovibrio hydrogenovorans TaxID=53245 RepID=UPI00048B0C1A|nr:phage tail protein [Desulfonatronovibrio hydrogenovorans]
MQPTISISSDDIRSAQRDLNYMANEMPWVAVRALNKAMTGVKTDLVSIIRERYNYKAAALRKRITIAKATRQNIRGHVQSKGGPVHLTDITGTRQTKKGISVDVRKSTGRRVIPRAFKASGRISGKQIVFRRQGDPPKQISRLVPRYPIQAITTAHPEVLYNSPENWTRIQTEVARRLDTNIQREIDAEFRKQQGKWG